MVSLCSFFFFIWVLQPVKIISLILSRQSYGVAKMGDLQEKPPDHPQAELGSNPLWWDDKRFRALMLSVLNHSATGTAHSAVSWSPTAPVNPIEMFPTQDYTRATNSPCFLLPNKTPFELRYQKPFLWAHFRQSTYRHYKPCTTKQKLNLYDTCSDKPCLHHMQTTIRHQFGTPCSLISLSY